MGSAVEAPFKDTEMVYGPMPFRAGAGEKLIEGERHPHRFSSSLRTRYDHFLLVGSRSASGRSLVPVYPPEHAHLTRIIGVWQQVADPYIGMA